MAEASTCHEMRQLPLRPRHDVNGATFVVHAGWEVPAGYSNLDDEVAAVRSTAGVVDVSDRVKVRVTGTDRVSFLNGLVTQDLASMPPGRWSYALVLNPKGKVVGDVWIYGMEDAFLLDLPADEAGWVMTHIRKHLISDDVLLEEFPAAHISLHGPLAPSFLRRLVGAVTLPQGPGAYTSIQIDKKSSMLVAGSDYLWVPGYEIFSWTNVLDDVWRRFTALGVRPVGREAWNTLRIEAGRPRAGVDMDETVIALEARMESAISFTKGCYEGQETIARATYQGHMNRFLVGFRVESDIVPVRGDPVMVEDKRVGEVTSATYSPTLRSVIAMGYARRPHHAPGTRVVVESDGWQLRGAIVPMPFIPGR